MDKSYRMAPESCVLWMLILTLSAGFFFFVLTAGREAGVANVLTVATLAIQKYRADEEQLPPLADWKDIVRPAFREQGMEPEGHVTAVGTTDGDWLSSEYHPASGCPLFIFFPEVSWQETIFIDSDGNAWSHRLESRRRRLDLSGAYYSSFFGDKQQLPTPCEKLPLETYRPKWKKWNTVAH